MPTVSYEPIVKESHTLLIETKKQAEQSRIAPTWIDLRISPTWIDL